MPLYFQALHPFQVPPAPSGLTAVAASTTSIQLAFTTNNVLATTYEIFQCAGVGCTPAAPPIVTLGPTTVANISQLVTGLTPGVSYTYYVLAVNAQGLTSQPSNLATASTTSDTGPSAPGTLTATPISTTQINLSWMAAVPTGGATITTYTVFRNGVEIGTTPGTTLSFSSTGLTPATAYNFTVSATDNEGLTGPLSNVATAQTQATGLGRASPVIGGIFYGGDQSYGRDSTTGFAKYTTAAVTTPAGIAVQNMGAYDLVAIGASFESAFSDSPCPKSDLITAMEGGGSFPIARNTSRPVLPFLYCIMESAQFVTTGGGYQTWETLCVNNKWALYSGASASGNTVPSAASGPGFTTVNYAYTYPLSDVSVVGTVYGSNSSGQGPALTAATYFSTALLSTNRTADARFSALNANNAAPNAAGLFLDNCFIYPNGGGTLNASTSAWDGTLQGSNTAVGPYTGAANSPVSSMLARGQYHFFQQYQANMAALNPGKTYYNIGNGAGYADVTANGSAATATSNAIANTFHGLLLEDIFGVAGVSWQTYRTWPQVLANINSAVAFCQSPAMVMVGIRVPASDGSSTCSFFTGGTTVTVASNTAQEYQFVRCAMCAIMMTAAIPTFGSSSSASGYNQALTKWYDEAGDDSGAQVNVKRGYLGIPTSAVPTAAAFSNGVWGRLYPNGLVLFNPWSNGPQTLTLAQIQAVFPGNYLAPLGTQQPTINNGKVPTTISFLDGDGRILLKDTATQPTITNTSLPSATVASAYNATITGGGGTTPYAFTQNSATPNTGGWLAFNPTTGVISGTPGTAASGETESVSYSLVDALGRSSPVKPLSIIVNAAAGSFVFAPNRPAGLTTQFDRTFAPADLLSGGAQDQYGLNWFISSSGNTAQTPFIETPAAASSRWGVTVPPPPDGASTILEIFYPTGYTSGNTPFQLNWKNSGSMAFKKMYCCFLVFIPAFFNSNGENIKWFGISQGAASTNHLCLLSSNGGNGQPTGTVSSGLANLDYRSCWLGLQGGAGNQNLGGEGGPVGATAIAQLSTTQFNPTGSGNGWWTTTGCNGVWCQAEYLLTQETVPGNNTATFMSWLTPFSGPFAGQSKLCNSWTNFSFNQASGGVNSFNIWNLIPYWGGGGASPTSNMYIGASRQQLACA
jgi:chitodextrinase